MRRRYDLQQTEIETLNTKAGITLAYLGALFIAALNATPEVIQLALQTWLIALLGIVTLVLYILAGLSCIMALRSWTFQSPVGVVRHELEDYLDYERRDLIRQLLSQYSDYTQENIPVFDQKNTWFVRSLVLTVAFTLLLLVTGTVMAII